MISYRFCLCHSLEKVFPNRKPEAVSKEFRLQAWKEERIAFQLAYYVDCAGVDLLEEELEVEIRTGGHIQVTLKKVGLVPGAFPCNGEHDDDYLTTYPGLFPDILIPAESGRIRGIYRQWRALWIELKPETFCEAGSHRTEIVVKNHRGAVIWCAEIPLMVCPAALPGQRLIHTELFHADCLADYYRVEVFSPEHWEIMEHFIKTASVYGMNMIFTPLFTPPMDTKEGGERTTVQLIGVERAKEGWRYDFSRLRQWIVMCLGCGMEYFEMAPLFTQWGAKAAPKIMGTQDGKQVRLFGWETEASGEAYTGFLQDFLPKLVDFLKEEGVMDRVWFHVSDEPTKWNMESYKKAHKCVQACLPGCRLMDAISDFELYQQGLVQHPVVSNNHLEPFLEAGIEKLWTYYCCVQGVDVSNRFFAMPSYRNRIIGVQLYLYRMEGFLHWGYNFYNSRYSMEQINPYCVTDCGEEFPSGDPFLVYPGADGKPVLSIRMMVLSEAMNDLRAFEYLETLTSREHVEQMIKACAGMQITFKQYPREASFLLKLREWINDEIRAYIDRPDGDIV